MNTIRITVLLAAFACLTSLAIADDDAKALTGAKVKVIQLGTDGIPKELDGLPQNIQEMLKKHRNLTGARGSITIIGPDGKEMTHKFGGEKTPKAKNAKKTPDVDVQLFGNMKAFRIGPNGIFQGVDQLPKDVRELLMKRGVEIPLGTGSINGSITVIGPDGKAQTHKIGDGKLNGKDLSQAIQDALSKSGKDLPQDMQKKLANALKDLPGLKIQQIPQREKAPQNAKSVDSDSINKKLDAILRRLDQLEKRMDEKLSDK